MELGAPAFWSASLTYNGASLVDSITCTREGDSGALASVPVAEPAAPVSALALGERLRGLVLFGFGLVAAEAAAEAEGFEEGFEEGDGDCDGDGSGKQRLVRVAWKPGRLRVAFASIRCTAFRSMSFATISIACPRGARSSFANRIDLRAYPMEEILERRQDQCE